MPKKSVPSQRLLSFITTHLLAFRETLIQSLAYLISVSLDHHIIKRMTDHNRNEVLYMKIDSKTNPL